LKDRLIVDGLNVIGSRPDRWWRDREGAIRDIVGRLERYAKERGQEVTVVFDAHPLDLALSHDSPIQVVFASPSVRNAADDEIVRIVEADPEPETLRVVTSDVELTERVEAAGAHLLTAGSFRAELDSSA
jgi:predicted RNA-binding protein with PIN domain